MMTLHIGVLGEFLLAGLGLAGLCSLAAPRAGRLARLVMAACVVAACGVAAASVFHFIGAFGFGGSGLPADRLYRVEFMGFRAPRNSVMTLRCGGAFGGACGEDVLELRTRDGTAAKPAGTWEIRSRASNAPVRLAGRAINGLPLEPGEDVVPCPLAYAPSAALAVTYSWDHRFFRADALRVRVAWSAAAGSLFDGRLELDELRDFQSLDASIRRVVKGAGRRRLADAAAKALGGIKFAREVRGDKGSRLLVLRAHEADEAGAPAAPGQILEYGRDFVVRLGTGDPARAYDTVVWPQPPSWPVEASFFVSTSSGAFRDGMNGIEIDRRPDGPPLLATAAFDAAKKVLMVSDGARTAVLHPGESTRDSALWAFAGGAAPVLRFVPYAGWSDRPGFWGGSARWLVPRAGAVALVLLTVLACLGARSAFRASGDRAAHLNAACASVFCFAVALCGVRVLLGFRAGAFPPEDARLVELARVFDKAPLLAVAALLLLPCAVLWAWRATVGKDPLRRLQERLDSSFGRPADTATPQAWAAVLIPFLAGFQRYVHRSPESFLGIRTGSLVVILIFWDLFIRSAQIERLDLRERLRLLMPATFAAGLQMFWVRDHGFGLIHLLPLMAFGWLASTLEGPRALVPETASLPGRRLLLGVLLFFSAAAWSLSGGGLAARLPSSVRYRLAAWRGDWSEALSATGAAKEGELDGVRRNKATVWTLSDQARSGAEPAGFGDGVLTRAGLGYAPSLCDGVYAIFVLSEHGGGAGAALVFLYLGLCITLLGAVPYLGRGERWRLPLLAAVGLRFAWGASYMALANLSCLPLTGQNLPGLALVGGSDVLETAALLALAVLLLRGGGPEPHAGPAAFVEAEPRAWAACRALLAAVFACFPPWAWLMSHPSAWPGQPGDLELVDDPEIVKRMEASLPDGSGRRRLRLEVGPTGYRLEHRPQFGGLTIVEQEALRQFNRCDLARQRGGACGPYRVVSAAPPRIALDLGVYRQRSPRARSWGGRIVARGEPRLWSVTQQCPLILSKDGEARTVALSRALPGTARFQLARLQLGPGGPVLCEVYRSGDDLFAAWRQKGTCYAGGRDVALAGGAYRLAPNDLLVVTDGKGAEAFQFFGTPIVLVSHPKINGKPTRFLGSEAAGVPQVRPTLELADEAVRRGVPFPDTVALNIDLAWQERLRSVITTWVRGEREDDRPDWISVTAIDAWTGRNIAAAAWLPEGDRDGELETILKNFEAGSAAKIMLVGAAASVMAKRGLDIGKLETVHRLADPGGPWPPSPRDGEKGFHPHHRAAGLSHGRSCGAVPKREREVISLAECLERSLNWCVWETLAGTLVTPDDTWRVRVPAPPGWETELYEGKPFRLDLLQAKQSIFTKDPGVGVLNAPGRSFADTLLAKGLADVFSVERSTQSVRARCRRYLGPAFCDERLLDAPALAALLPQAVDFPVQPLNSFSRDVIDIFLGTGYGVWNSVSLVEGLSRLLTGRKIEVGLTERQVGPEKWGAMPFPLERGSAWMEHNMIGPMRRRVAGLECGDAECVGKTGTIDSFRRRETEVLLFAEGPRGLGAGTVVLLLRMRGSKAKDGEMKKLALGRDIAREVRKLGREAMRPEVRVALALSDNPRMAWAGSPR